MSDLRMNSVAGAVLASVLGVMGVGVIADALIHPNYPETPGYAPEVVVGPVDGPVAPAGPPDFGLLFADAAGLEAFVTRGERVAAQCRTCHTFEAGGANGVGPNLHDVFGRGVASHGGFTYSDAMAAHGGSWGYLQLNSYLRSPAQDIRGNRMAFAGLRNDQDRVAAIAYLRSISPNSVPLPAPLPQPEPAATEAETPAEAPPG